MFTRVRANIPIREPPCGNRISVPLAGVLEAEAILDELKQGARKEEIAVKEAELAKYEQDLANEYAGILDIAIDAFNKADDALHTKMTGIFSGFKTSSYKFTYQICDSQLDLNGVSLKYQAEIDLMYGAKRIQRSIHSQDQMRETRILSLKQDRI